MISADFAPNESLQDALASLSALLKPWEWRKGKAIFKVKQKLKKMFGGNHDVFLFLTGRVALYRFFQALDFKEGAEVAIQAFTCEAVVLPLLELKLKPVYVDIEKETYSMNPEDLISKITPQTKALILQHTYGMTPKHRSNILAFAREAGIIVIEDLAHGFDQDLFQHNTEPQSSFLLLSFGRSKFLSSVFGGAVLSDNKTVSETLKDLEKTTSYPSSYFITSALWYKPLAVLIRKTYDIFLGKFIHAVLNHVPFIPREISSVEKRGEFDPLYAKAYPNALAKLLLKQFKQIDQITQKRYNAISNYNKYFFPKSSPKKTPPLIRYPLLTDHRDKLISAARKKNIYLGKWYDQVVAPKELPLHKFHYVTGSCPVAEETCKKVINLPTTISLKEADRVLDVVVQAS